MTQANIRSHWWHPLFRRIAATGWGAKLSSLLMHHLDKPIYRWSSGRITLATILIGVPVITLTTIGAKSNEPRTIPLVSIPDGDKMLLIASNWGGEKHPAWYFNLKAHPEAQITFHQETRPYIAKELFGAERERCWQTAVAIYPGYQNYQQRTKRRTIPVMELSPLR